MQINKFKCPTSLFLIFFIWWFVSQEVLHSSQALQEEKEEVKRRLEEATARIVQLEEDLIGVTQKGLQKETELDRWLAKDEFRLFEWIHPKICRYALIWTDFFLYLFFIFLSSLKDRLKKVALEKEALESHVKNERDEKELYKVMFNYFKSWTLEITISKFM